jgi:single-stranded-DNA-specific exonuclease
VLEEVNLRKPGLIPKFGGHAMAAGLSLPMDALALFSTLFDEVVAVHLAKAGDLDRIITDGELQVDEVSLSVARVLKQAVPFGQGFEAPLFDGVFEVVNQRLLKEKHLKLALRLDSGEEVDGIAFNVDPARWPNNRCRYVQLVYQLEVNVFRGRETVQLLIRELIPYAN